MSGYKFLTIDRIFLKELSELIENLNLDISLYIETRPEGINPNSIKLLKFKLWSRYGC